MVTKARVSYMSCQVGGRHTGTVAGSAFCLQIMEKPNKEASYLGPRI